VIGNSIFEGIRIRMSIRIRIGIRIRMIRMSKRRMSKRRMNIRKRLRRKRMRSATQARIAEEAFSLPHTKESNYPRRNHSQILWPSRSRYSSTE
jgi:hypothetical protein